eukprot:CAMPEP_0172447746 /NCGR_PEP_ID=MMETSP1065-20121228/6980_1 /TAXON_ID=265537 /ORGANISM="Amphiprora paludosa, Strain CCMP125" /LENGTH=165 /DNA_ID=CAMNT_0013199113 /DNA_START=35 /DNA_END=532 /DNA_ORIENTATION=+
MGQASSTEAATIDEPAVKISPALGEKIALDYQNEELNKAWQGVQVSILNRRNQREQAMSAALTQQKMANEEQRQIMAARHRRLDERIEALNGDFANRMAEIEHGTSMLKEDLDEIQNKKQTLPCLGPRAHWLDCHKKYALDSRPCDAYLATLEKCVTEAIVKIVS